MRVGATEALISKAHAVIDESFARGAEVMVPMFSGGHDSLCATYLASLHPKFEGSVDHIRTGIGSKATFAFIEQVCAEYGWKLNVYQSPSTFEMFVRERGFPGPGRHQWVYNRLKDRCVRMITKKFTGKNVALITGCRYEESVRRMGHVEPVKIGEIARRKMFNTLGGMYYEFLVVNKRRYWTAPCHDWSTEDQQAFMDHFDLPRNPVKLTPIGMSGECLCGAFARPNEIAMLRKYVPDVAMEIDRLAEIARGNGKHAVWGTRPPRSRKGIVLAQTGPLCNSCDTRAMSAGILLQCDLNEPVHARTK